MLERVRELWADRPVLVAAAGIAPVAFVVTFLVLFLAVGGDAGQPLRETVAQQETPSNDASGDQTAQQQEGSSQPAVTVIVQGGQAQQQQEAATESAADPAGQSESQQTEAEQQQADQPTAQTQQQQAEASAPQVVAGFQVVPLGSLLEEELDPAALKHGSDGSEGAILPLGNGVVRSSGEQHDTSWELIIPSAGLRSAVVSLGRTPNGAMGSPDNPYVVGWLDSTPAPGEVGNTLLAGHRDYEDITGNIGTGVCWELNNTQVGDHMLIWDDELNVYYVYTVTEAVTLDPTDPDSARFLHNTEVAVITLITCTGSFNTETHRYSHRLVVVGELAAVASPDA